MTAEQLHSLGVRRVLVRELAGKVCRCGEPKKQGMSFCRDCYYSLPVSVRQNLYKKIGQGYEEAHESACRALDRAEAS